MRAGRLGLGFWLCGLAARRALLLPILIATCDNIDLTRAIEAKRDRDGAVEKVAIMADDQDGACLLYTSDAADD